MRLWYLLFTVMAVGGFANCSFDTKPIVGAPGTGGITGTGTGGGFVLPGTGGRPVIPCTGLRCQQPTCFGAGCAVPACPSGMVTTVTGTVFDPAGKVPLYNAKVYVPNAPLAEIHEGPSCDACATSLSGDPITQADSDVAGHFTLTDMPVGNNIPIVVQIGKWRRQTTIANVPACVTTALTDPAQTRLPRNQSEGHIPKIALSTGGADALECLLRKIGIEDSEFTPETGTGRINLYAGGMNAGNNTGDGTLGYAPTVNGGPCSRGRRAGGTTWTTSTNTTSSCSLAKGSRTPPTRARPRCRRCRRSPTLAGACLPRTGTTGGSSMARRRGQRRRRSTIGTIHRTR